MRLLLALIVPWLQFFTIGRPFAGIICLILQITLIGLDTRIYLVSLCTQSVQNGSKNYRSTE